jgi:hypothetical protein
MVALARMRAVDGLNARFGRDAVRFGGTSKPRPWRLRSDRLSPREATHWDELLRVNGWPWRWQHRKVRWVASPELEERTLLVGMNSNALLTRSALL